MRDPQGPGGTDNVIPLAKFRKNAIIEAHIEARRERRQSSIRIDVDENGDVDDEPYKVFPGHALMLLSMSIALSGYLLEVYSKHH